MHNSNRKDKARFMWASNDKFQQLHLSKVVNEKIKVIVTFNCNRKIVTAVMNLESVSIRHR